ncbi:hypothetical protein ACFYXM_27795 [Streptomyces sp. NPDC002476]|uniref:hypothetical protein n=1 Tax=Streptomyces sp. NPDC002476 TaxID=3364648 RepID=UPI0036C5E0B1
MLSELAIFAWCFSHGRLRRFAGEPWCTATLARLPGATEQKAVAAKLEQFDDATFLHQLPGDQYLAIIPDRSDCAA